MNSPFYVGNWLVEPLLNKISTNGEVFHLEPKVMQALLHLSEHAGSVVQKSDLLKVVWPDVFVTDDVMTRCIFELRKALRDNSRNPRYICTVHKRGYRLIAPIRLATERAGKVQMSSRSRQNKLVLTLVIVVLAGAVLLSLGINHGRRSRNAAKSARAQENFLMAQQYCSESTLSLWDENGTNAPARALMYYAEAIKDDPYVAEFHSGLAACYDHLVDRYKMLPIQGWTNARKAAGQALAINPRLSSPRMILGKAKLFLDHDWAGAEQLFRQAVAIDPDSIEPRLTLAEHLCRLGKKEEALLEAEKLRDSKPVGPEIVGRIGTLFFYLRRYPDAEAEFERAIGLDANNPFPHYWLALLYEAEHRYPEWIEQRLRALQTSGSAPEKVEEFRHAYLRGGYEAFWRMQLETGGKWAESHPESALRLNYARILLRLHDDDRALSYLKMAAEEGHPDFFDLTVDPIYDPIRHDPRFRDVMNKLGLREPTP
jgi:DNA-binding winged helix-turn-helix (wHTH) protein